MFKAGEYTVESDPVIRQRLADMQDGNSRDECLRKLYSHLPSSSCNEDLMQLQVTGTSVYESEKAHALDLLNKAKFAERGPGAT